MRIAGSIPYHVARAYGAGSPRAATPASAAPRPDRAGHDPTAPEASSPRGTGRLVAARVRRGVEFTASPAPASARESYPLYTRAADTVEAAVAIRIGRSIDVRG